MLGGARYGEQLVMSGRRVKAPGEFAKNVRRMKRIAKKGTGTQTLRTQQLPVALSANPM